MIAEEADPSKTVREDIHHRTYVIEGLHLPNTTEVFSDPDNSGNIPFS